MWEQCLAAPPWCPNLAVRQTSSDNRVPSSPCHLVEGVPKNWVSEIFRFYDFLSFLGHLNNAWPPGPWSHAPFWVILGTLFAILGPSGHSGAFRVLLAISGYVGHFGLFWAILGHSGPSGPFWALWALLAILGLWAILGNIGYSGSLAILGPLIPQGHFGPSGNSGPFWALWIILQAFKP